MFNRLSNGMGGIDWSGLELMVEHFGVDDVEGLIDRLALIKGFRAPTEEEQEE